MVDTKSQKTLESFVKGIMDLDQMMEESHPDILIYPIKGAIPIADLLRIVNPGIESYHSEYMPSSSTIEDTNKVINQWFYNFLEDQHIRGEPQTIISIDEVVSGSSVTRVHKQVRKAIQEYTHKTGIDPSEINFQSLCIEDSRHIKAGKHLHNSYKKLIREGKAIPVKVEANLVMDRPEYCPLKLQRIPEHMHGKCLPIMDSYSTSKDYLDFLKRFATEIGQDLQTVHLQRPAKILESERFLPEKYKSLKNYIDFYGTIENFKDSQRK
tara:strand:+ start:97 stop:900 length:804 start_codon:yes stop_codon:yes gene_type:complete